MKWIFTSKIYNITLTLMFIYIYQNFILVLSVNEHFLYSTIFLSEKVKRPRCCMLKKHFPEKPLAALTSQYSWLVLQDTVVYFRKRARVWPVTEMLFSLPGLWWQCSHMANKSMLEKHWCKCFWYGLQKTLTTVIRLYKAELLLRFSKMTQRQDP